jgi:predicted amidohydrolase YtcJ
MASKKAWKVPTKALVIALAALVLSVLVAMAQRKAGVVVYEFAGVLGVEDAAKAKANAKPKINAVAIRGGEVEAIGNIDDLKRLGRLDRRYAQLYAARGFHDSSVRLAASCVALSADFIIAPEAWPKRGGGFWPAAKTRPEFERALKSAGSAWKAGGRERERGDGGFALIFGHAPGVHGPLSRSDLDAAFSDLPCIVASRCFGCFTTSSAALSALGMLRGYVVDRLSRIEGADLTNGKFSGASAMTFARVAFGGERGRARLDVGAELLATHLSSVGITSVRDSTSSFAFKKWAEAAFYGKPLDVRISLDPMPSVARDGFERAGLRMTAEFAGAPGGEDANVGWHAVPSAHLKIDGAAAAGSRQSKRADGGTWTWPQEHLDSMCKAFLGRGYGVRYETNGSFGLDIALSHLHRRTFEMTKPPGATSIEILAVEADGLDAAEKAAAVEARVSFDPFFSAGGKDVVLPAFESAGVEMGAHSGMPCGGAGPADPLETARVARTRGASRLAAVAMLAPPKSDGPVANFAVLDADPTFDENASVVGVIVKGKPGEVGPRSALPREARSLKLDEPFGERASFDPGYISDAIVDASFSSTT